MTLYQLLSTQLNIPVAYGYFSEQQSLPYICLMGSGQDTFGADDTYFHKHNRTQIELYFKQKDPALEERIESLLLENGYMYSKSEDVYVEDEDVFMIYYDA